jgi:hypothetical protein
MIFRIASIVLFIIAAVFLFLVDTITVKTDLGLIAAGLACLAAEPFHSYVVRQ